MFGSVCAERLGKTLAVLCMSASCTSDLWERLGPPYRVYIHQILLLTLQDESLYRACFACRMIKVERALLFYIIVSSIAQAVVFADQYFGGSAWEFGRCVLLLIVLLESRCEL